MKGSLDLISIGLLLLLAPLFVFPKENWNWVLLPLVSILFFSRWIIERQFLLKTPIDVALALLIVMAFTGIFLVKGIGESAGKLVGLVYGIIVFYTLIDALKSVKRLKIAVLVFLVAGLVLAIVGTVGRKGYREPFLASIESKMPSLPEKNFGLKGAEHGINPNALGGCLLLFLPLGLIQVPLLLKRNPDGVSFWMRGISFVGLVALLGIQVLAVLLSVSLGTWFALTMALWLMARCKKPINMIIAGIFVAIFVLVFFTNRDQAQSKNMRMRGVIERSLENRVDIWKAGIEIVRAHPVLGIGMDQLRRTPTFTYDLSHAHNQFLHTAAELGIPGLIAYLAILIGVYWISREVRRSDLPEWMRLTSRGLGTGIFAFTIFGMGDAIPLGAKPGIFFWISLAMIMSIYLYGRNGGFLKKNEKRSN